MKPSTSGRDVEPWASHEYLLMVGGLVAAAIAVGYMAPLICDFCTTIFIQP